MGAWIALNQFKLFKNQIKGFIGIGAAPEFTSRILWKKFTCYKKKKFQKKLSWKIKSGEYEYPISYQLIKDGWKNRVLSKKIKTRINVTMIHGANDEIIPISLSKKVLSTFVGAKKKLLIIKNGDHSLSKKSNLKKIINELRKIIFDIT